MSYIKNLPAAFLLLLCLSSLIFAQAEARQGAIDHRKISPSEGEDSYHAALVVDEPKIAGDANTIRTVHHLVDIGDERLIVFMHVDQYLQRAGGSITAHMFNVATGEAGKMHSFFEEIVGDSFHWGAFSLRSVWMPEKSSGLLFAAMKGDGAEGHGFFAVVPFDERGRPTGDPVILDTIDDINKYVFNAWAAPTLGKNSIGLTYGYTIGARKGDKSAGNKWRNISKSKAFFIELDFDGAPTGKVKEIPIPNKGKKVAAWGFAPQQSGRRWLVPFVTAKYTRDFNGFAEDHLYVALVNKRRARLNEFAVVDRTELARGQAKPERYVNFMPIFNDLQFIDVAEDPNYNDGTFQLFSVDRSFGINEGHEAKRFDSTVTMWAVDKRGRLEKTQGQNNDFVTREPLPVWMPEVGRETLDAILTIDHEERISNMHRVADGKLVFYYRRNMFVLYDDGTEGELYEPVDAFFAEVDLDKGSITVLEHSLSTEQYLGSLMPFESDLICLGQNDFLVGVKAYREGYISDGTAKELVQFARFRELTSPGVR